MLERKSVAQEAADYLRDRILGGEIEPGTRLREERLATELRISRNTLREAFRILDFDGLVHREPHHGASVADLTVQDVKDIYLARRTVEPAAVRTASTDGVPPTVREIAEELQVALDEENLDRVAELDLEYHCTLVDAVGSRRLSTSFRTMMTELRLAFLLLERAIAGSTVSDVDEHIKLLRLMEAGSVENALELHRAHLERGERSVLDLMQTSDDSVNDAST